MVRTPADNDTYTYTLDNDAVREVLYALKNSTKSYQEVSDEFGVPKADVMGIHLGRIKTNPAGHSVVRTINHN